jgi:anti-sigma regulatory factor (Ser/Thr protein kinase)
MAELVRALHARAAEHPESPGLIASWPGVPASRMPAACAELQRQGQPVREIMIEQPHKARRAWVMAARSGDTDWPIAPGPLSQEPTVLVHAVAEPATIPVARRTVAIVARREGASQPVCAAIALAVTEACTNVVVHAYAEWDAPGNLDVRAGKVAGALIVEVADEGRGLLPRLAAPGLGLGLLLMAQLADVFEIRTRGDRRGVAVRMRFNLEATEAIS